MRVYAVGSASQRNGRPYNLGDKRHCTAKQYCQKRIGNALARTWRVTRVKLVASNMSTYSSASALPTSRAAKITRLLVAVTV